MPEPAEIIAKMRYLCYNSLKPPLARLRVCRAHADALVRMGLRTLKHAKTAASAVLSRPLARARASNIYRSKCGFSGVVL